MAIKFALLALLTHGEQSANQLRLAFDEHTSAIWPLNIGQVAQTLRRLERDGLIEATGNTTSTNGREVQLYAITASGTAALEQWWRTPVVHIGEERDELLTKIALAKDRSDVNLIDLLDRQRAGVVEKLQTLHRKHRSLPNTQLVATLLYERTIFNLEAEARWLDRVEAIITDQGVTP